MTFDLYILTCWLLLVYPMSIVKSQDENVSHVKVVGATSNEGLLVTTVFCTLSCSIQTLIYL